MGAEVDARQFTREDRTRLPAEGPAGLDALARMLTESRFDFERPMTGLEIELNLIDDDYQPAMRNAEVLAAIADPSFQTELGRFNIEINVAPRRLADGGFSSFEQSVRKALNDAEPRGRGGGQPPGDGRHPADPDARARPRSTVSARTRGTPCSTSRSSPPAVRTWRSPSTAPSGCR